MKLDDSLNSDLVDLPSFLRVLRRERHPTAVVIGPPLCGKTTYARLLAEQHDFEYIDVLGYIAHSPELCTCIDRFDPADLKAVLLNMVGQTTAEVMLVDELDFLLHMWAADLDSFREMVGRLYYPQRAVAFAFFLQTWPRLEQWSLVTASRSRRILAFEQLKALKGEAK